jgi:hypothetical protein
MKSSGIVKATVGTANEVRGLYNPDEFRDNCGFGMIAHQQGVPSHRLLQTAIESLTCMTTAVVSPLTEKRAMDAVYCSRCPPTSCATVREIF